MTATPGEKVDPAHWVGLFGGALMFLVLALVSLGLTFPWWTEHFERPGQKGTTEVSLWVLYTRYQLEADRTTLNCESSCDFTMLGSAKVRESRIGWSDVCMAQAEQDDSSRQSGGCQKIWVVRAGTMMCWFFALLFSALSTFNFCGAGLPASVRCAPAIKLVLGSSCVFALTLALVTAQLMDVKLEPIPPGTEPRDRPPPPKVGLNGPGFLCVVVSCILSILASGIAYLAQNVTNHLAELNDSEQGRPMADVNRGDAPNLDHQVQKPPRQSSKQTVPAIQDVRPDSADSFPAPVKVGGWTDASLDQSYQTQTEKSEM